MVITGYKKTARDMNNHRSENKNSSGIGILKNIKSQRGPPVISRKYKN
jgi:hypothetical protein